LAFTGGSLLPGQKSHTAGGEGFDGVTAVLVKEVLLGGAEKLFALARGGGIEREDALDESIGSGSNAIGGTDLGDEADLLRARRVNGVTEKDEGKRETRESVFEQIGHDGRGGEAGTDLGKLEDGMFGYQGKIAEDGQTEAKAKGVALDFGDGYQGRVSEGALEVEDARGFAADGCGVAAGAFASGAEDGAAGAKAQDAYAWTGGLGTKFPEHGVEHCASNFVAVDGIVQGEGENISRAFDDYAGNCAGAVSGGALRFLEWHAGTV
jgi:hypothetical protein